MGMYWLLQLPLGSPERVALVALVLIAVLLFGALKIRRLARSWGRGTEASQRGSEHATRGTDGNATAGGDVSAITGGAVRREISPSGSGISSAIRTSIGSSGSSEADRAPPDSTASESDDTKVYGGGGGDDEGEDHVDDGQTRVYQVDEDR